MPITASSNNEKGQFKGGLQLQQQQPQFSQPPSDHANQQSQKPTNPQQQQLPQLGLANAHSNIQIRTVFMDEEKQAKAIEMAREACTNEKMGQSPREIAGHIKTAFDNLYGPAWHCIVGRSYGSFVTHEKNNFIFFYIDQWAIMLFKTA